MEIQILWIVLGGAFGGLIKALFDGEHKLAKPQFVGKYFYLGFLANVVIGIGTAIVGMSYFYNPLQSESIPEMSVLHILGSSISFGIAANAIIEGVVEKISNNKKDLPF